MHDWYLLSTPLLMFLVVALVGFVGCDKLFGLQHIDPPPEPPKNLTAVPTTNRIDLSWEAPSQSGVTGYNVKRGTTAGQYSVTRQPSPATSLSYADIDVTDGMTYYYVVSALYGTKESSNTDELPVTSGDPNLTSLVTPGNLITRRNNFTGFVGMGIRVAATGLTVKTLGRWYVPGNVDTHVVKLVDASTKADVPGGSATVIPPTMDLATPRFVYGQLSAPIPLASGADYFVVSEETNGGDEFYDAADTTVTTTAKATRVYAVNGDSAGTYSVSGVLGSSYGPVDLQY